MSRLLSDRANHHALKCVLSALEKGSPINVTLTSAPLSFGVSKVPYLLDDRVSIFCPNEMAKFVWNASIPHSELAILEWERTKFSSAIAALYTKRKFSPAVLGVLQEAEKVILPSIRGNSGIAEIVMWSAMIPAFCKNGLLEAEQREGITELNNWFGEFAVRHAKNISAAYSLLGVQEEADFLRVRPKFALTNPSDKPFYVTTPIYYVNAAPHIGHVYSTLIADSLARYHRLKGEEVFFMTGTDEHGQKVAQAAEAKNMTPYDFTTEVSNSFKECFAAFGMKWEHFIRTTDEEHIQVVQEMWRTLEAKGDIYLGKYEGWYCVSDEAFLTPQNITDGVDKNGNPCKVSLESGHPVTWMVEENYKFKLSKFQEPLLQWLRANRDCIVPEFRRQEVIKFVEGGLLDLSVSRRVDQCSWGIPVPGNEKHVIYVWLDALSNYFTSSRLKDGKVVDFEQLRRWPADLHVIGKDILKFHAVYWPAFLMSAGLPLPRKIVAHGWWTKDGKKISKSLNNAFDPLEKGHEFGLDALKYFLLRDSTFADDGDYNDPNMVARLNGELADTLGNLLLRCVSKKVNPAAVWPAPNSLTERDQAIIDAVRELPGVVDHYFLLPDMQKALIAIFDVLRELNLYATENAPWKLVKDDPVRLDTVLFVMMESLRVCITLLSPVLVDTVPKMLALLGVPPQLHSGIESFKFGAVAAGTPIGETQPEILFAKADLKKYTSSA